MNKISCKPFYTPFYYLYTTVLVFTDYEKTLQIFYVNLMCHLVPLIKIFLVNISSNPYHWKVKSSFINIEMHALPQFYYTSGIGSYIQLSWMLKWS